MSNTVNMEALLTIKSDISNVTSNVNKIKQELGKIKLPSNLQSQFDGLFGNIEKRSEKLGSILSQKHFSNTDTKNINNYFNEIIRDYERISELSQKLNGQKLDLSQQTDQLRKLKEKSDNLAKSIDENGKKIQNGLNNSIKGLDSSKITDSISKEVEDILKAFKNITGSKQLGQVSFLTGTKDNKTLDTNKITQLEDRLKSLYNTIDASSPYKEKIKNLLDAFSQNKNQIDGLKQTIEYWEKLKSSLNTGKTDEKTLDTVLEGLMEKAAEMRSSKYTEAITAFKNKLENTEAIEEKIKIYNEFSKVIVKLTKNLTDSKDKQDYGLKEYAQVYAGLIKNGPNFLGTKYINPTINDLNDQINNIASSIVTSNGNSGYSGIVDSLKTLQTEFTNTTLVSKDFKKSLDNIISANFSSLPVTEQINKIDTAITELQQLLNNPTTAVSSNSGQIQQTISELENFKTSLVGLQTQEEQQEQLTHQIFQYTEEGIQKIASDVSTMAHQGANSLDPIRDKTDKTVAGFASLDEELNRVFTRFSYFFSAANMVNLFRRAVSKAVETVKELDETMTETAVVTEYTVSDMWSQLPQYTKTASELGVAINDVYEATTLYYQQGLSTNEVEGVSVETLKMARIAGLEAADATDAMTAALRGFNKEVNQANAQNVSDVYSNLAAKSASNVEELSTAMEKVASIASSANMEFENTAALLAQIIETTRESAETAGTALKTVIARFSEVKELYSEGQLTGEDDEGEEIDVNNIDKALKTAGIDLKSYFLGEVGLDDIFLELASKWDSLTDVQQRYIATQAAGSRQQSRFIAMMSDYSRTQELVGYAYDSAGASEQQYEKTLESLETKLAKLKNAWQTFILGITNNEVIKLGVDILTKFLEILNEITDIMPGITKSFANLGITIAGLSLGKRALGNIIKNLRIDFGLAEGNRVGWFSNPNKTTTSTETNARLSSIKTTEKAALAGVKSVVTAAESGVAKVTGAAVEGEAKETTAAVAGETKEANAAINARTVWSAIGKSFGNPLTKSFYTSFGNLFKKGGFTSSYFNGDYNLGYQRWVAAGNDPFIVDTSAVYTDIDKVSSSFSSLSTTLSIVTVGLGWLNNKLKENDKDNHVLTDTLGGVTTSLTAVTVTTIGLTTALNLLKAAEKAEQAQKLATFMTTGATILPVLAAIAAVAAAAYAGYKYVNAFSDSMERLGEKAEEYSEKLDELNELKTTQEEKISSVQELADEYELDVIVNEDNIDNVIDKLNTVEGITLTDKEQLELLRDENRELERQIWLSQQEADESNQSAIDEARNALKIDHGHKVYSASLYGYTENYSSISTGLQSAFAANTATLQTLQTKYDELQEQFSNGTDKEKEQLQGLLTAYENRIETIKNATLEEYDSLYEIYETLKQSTNASDLALAEELDNILTNYENLEKSTDEKIESFFGRDENKAMKKFFQNIAKGNSSTRKSLEKIINEAKLMGIDFEAAGFTVDQLNDYLERTCSNIEDADDAAERFKGTLSGLQEALETDDADADWKTISEAYEDIEELYTNNMVGTDDYQQYVSLLTGITFDKDVSSDERAETLAAAWGDAKKISDYYFNEDEGLGLYHAQEAIYNSGLVDENNNFVDSFKTSADAAAAFESALGGTQMGLEAVETIMKALEAQGWDWEDTIFVSDEFDKFATAYEELEALESSTTNDRVKDQVRDIIDQYKEAYELGGEDLENFLDHYDIETLLKITADVELEVNRVQLQEDFEDSIDRALLNIHDSGYRGEAVLAGMDLVDESIGMLDESTQQAILASNAYSAMTQAYNDYLLAVSQGESEEEQIRLWGEVLTSIDGVSQTIGEISGQKIDTSNVEDINNVYLGVKEAVESEGLNIYTKLNDAGIWEGLSDVQEEVSNSPITVPTTLGTYSGYIKSSTGTTELNGTAHADGTLQNSWKTKNGETALTGELGQEMVVHGDQWWTVGDKGPEFTNIPKGSIVFNHKQTRDLLSKGYTTNRGKALAHGTAYAAHRWSYKGTSDSSSSGSSDDSNKWENTLDKLYNLVEDVEAALRKQEKLEREYNRLLENENATATEIIANLAKQRNALQEELDLNNQLLAGRKKQLQDIGNETWMDDDGNKYSYNSLGLGQYAWYDTSNGVVQIDWDKINAITDEDRGDQIEQYISRLEELADEINDTEEEIEDIQDQIDEQNDILRDEAIDFIDRVREALIQQQQDKIDEYQDLSDVINDSNTDILNSLQEQIDLERQIRDNTEKETDIAAKERRLAYLRRDTSGANALEIKQLEEELTEDREEYQDTLVDQMISNLEDENEKAQEQREKQIELMQAQLDWMEESGGFNEEVERLIESSFNGGELKTDSELYKLLYEVDNVAAQTKLEQNKWNEEFSEQANQAMAGILANSGAIADMSSALQSNADANADKICASISQISFPTSSSSSSSSSGSGSSSSGTGQTSAEATADETAAAKEYANSKSTSTGTTYSQKVTLTYDVYLVDERTGNTQKKYANKAITATGSGSTEEIAYQNAYNSAINGIKTLYPVSKSYSYKVTSSQRTAFKTGGLADFTGPAWLDGTKTKPEMVLNSRDTENFIQLKDILSDILTGATSVTSPTTTGDNYFDINIDVKEIADDYDVDQLISKVKKEIYNNASYRNVNAINHIR